MSCVRPSRTTAWTRRRSIGWVETSVFYQGIGKGEPDDFKAVAARIAQLEAERKQPPNRVFYLALPPNAFPATIQGLGEAGLGRSTTGERERHEVLDASRHREAVRPRPAVAPRR